MSTNYYWYEKPACPCCERLYEPLHIGKSSAGWVFSLHVYPNIDINNLDDWKQLFEQSESYIVDEYDIPISFSEMVETITNRVGVIDWETVTDKYFTELWGNYANEANFHIINSSQRGPNGLLRCKLGPYHCVGHGEGTWDWSTSNDASWFNDRSNLQSPQA